MGAEVVNDALKKVRDVKYTSHYSRIVASCIDNFDAITRVKETSFNSGMGAAMASNTAQTVTAMQVSDEEYSDLEAKLKSLNTKTSNRLAIKMDVAEILKKALGKERIDDVQVEALISSVENKFEAFIKVKDKLAAKNMSEQAVSYKAYKDQNDFLTKTTIEAGAEADTIFQASLAHRISEGFGRVNKVFVKAFPQGEKKGKIAVQAFGLIGVAAGLAMTGDSND